MARPARPRRWAAILADSPDPLWRFLDGWGCGASYPALSTVSRARFTFACRSDVLADRPESPARAGRLAVSMATVPNSSGQLACASTSVGSLSSTSGAGKISTVSEAGRVLRNRVRRALAPSASSPAAPAAPPPAPLGVTLVVAVSFVALASTVLAGEIGLVLRCSSPLCAADPADCEAGSSSCRRRRRRRRRLRPCPSPLSCSASEASAASSISSSSSSEIGAWVSGAAGRAGGSAGNKRAAAPA